MRKIYKKVAWASLEEFFLRISSLIGQYKVLKNDLNIKRMYCYRKEIFKLVPKWDICINLFRDNIED